MTAPKTVCCSAKIYDDWGCSRFCLKKATVERDGKWFCAVHDPVSERARDQKRDDKFRAEWKKKAEDARAVRMFPDLVAALEMAASIIKIQNGNRHEDTNKAQRICNDLLAKAKEELS